MNFFALNRFIKKNSVVDTEALGLGLAFIYIDS